MSVQKTHEIGPDSLLTSYQVGALLQVNPSSVNKWVKDGRIPAFRTPGGHRRIRASDLVAFLDAHSMPVPRTLVNAAKRRLLIVDDESKELEALQRLFKPQGHVIDVKTADNGIDALMLIGSYKPHAVILDVMMPNVDGLELCRRLKANPDTRGLKVVLASGQLTADIEAKGEEAGADLTVTKPITAQSIFDLLDIPTLPQFAVTAV